MSDCTCKVTLEPIPTTACLYEPVLYIEHDCPVHRSEIPDLWPADLFETAWPATSR